MQPTVSLLDNPIWNSLTTTHAHLATSHRQARRYPSDIGPLAAFAHHPTPAAWADLATLIPLGDIAILFLDAQPTPPTNWQLLRDDPLVQMICRDLPAEPEIQDPILPLGPSDIPDMLALATLTEPGPFRPNTATLGGFFGIRVDGRLAAMAGRRLAPTGFAEVSAVCTHPDFRGRRYAQALVAAVARAIHADGLTPFLTSLAVNPAAIRVYEQVGFTLRRHFQLAVVKPPATPR